MCWSNWPGEQGLWGPESPAFWTPEKAFGYSCRGMVVEQASGECPTSIVSEKVIDIEETPLWVKFVHVSSSGRYSFLLFPIDMPVEGCEDGRRGCE